MGNRDWTTQSPSSPSCSSCSSPGYASHGLWFHELAELLGGEEPVCLVENSRQEGLVVHPEALQVLSGVTQPVVVVAYMEDSWEGVSVGPPTNGIWMCCLPHPHLPDHTLVLLRTKGHLDKRDPKGSQWLLVLTLLLSNVLIHSSHGDIDQRDVDRLRYLTLLPRLIKYKETPEPSKDLKDSDRFALFFPRFVWAVWDGALELKGKDGQGISEEEYLESVLRLQPGTDPKAQKHNRPRECIRLFFPERRCFVFQEEPQDGEIPPQLQHQREKFCRFLLKETPGKTLPGGLVVTGELLGKLAEIYVEQIQAGAVPCLERGLQDLVPVANAAVAAAAVKLYRERMEQSELLADTVVERLQEHERCERKALELFMERAFPDGISEGLRQFLTQVKTLKAEFLTTSDRMSRAICKAALQDLSQDMEARIQAGSYNVPGGFKQFRADKKALVERYLKLPNKGVKAHAVLLEFLRGKEKVARSILSADRSLSREERKMWSDRDSQQQSVLEQQLHKDKRDEELQQQEQQLRRRSALSRQLEKKLRDFEKRRYEEHWSLIAHKMKEEPELRQDGCHEQADTLLAVIHSLEQEYYSRGGNISYGTSNDGNSDGNGRARDGNGRARDGSGWNGGGNGWNGGGNGRNGGGNGDNSNSNFHRWMPITFAVLAVLAFVFFRI